VERAIRAAEDEPSDEDNENPEDNKLEKFFIEVSDF
jgi:hypothetical protein